MIDGHFKEYEDLFWNKVGIVVAKIGFTPNGITLAGVLLSIINSGAYIYHQNHLWYGIALIFIELLDNIDGAVARVTNTCSKFGAYLDAATDRYKESIMLFSIAFVSGYWIICFIAVTGSIITSYNKARAAMEKSVSNTKWPDFFERFERLIVVCAGLLLTNFIPRNYLLGYEFLFISLVILALFSHITAIQRLIRGYHILK